MLDAGLRLDQVPLNQAPLSQAPLNDATENPGARTRERRSAGMKEKRIWGAFNPNGCRIHPDCLNCPLPVCIQDMTPAEARQTVKYHEDEGKDQRIRELMERGITRGQAVISLTRQMGVKNTCNIYRKLKQHQLGKEARRQSESPGEQPDRTPGNPGGDQERLVHLEPKF